MSDRIGTKELAHVLVAKSHLSVKEAETFVALLFETLNEGLKQDRQVKIKGLGTFKVTGVSARKSVDVNTGEPILIESRNKISFAADAVMRDSVNKPFAQFDTVVVNDGINFADIDAKYRDEETEDFPDDAGDEPYVSNSVFVPQEDMVEEKSVAPAEVSGIADEGNGDAETSESGALLSVNQTRPDIPDSVYADKDENREQRQDRWTLTRHQLYILNTARASVKDEKKEESDAAGEASVNVIPATSPGSSVHRQEESSFASDTPELNSTDKPDYKAEQLERELDEIREKSKRHFLYLVVAGILLIFVPGISICYFSGLIHVRDNRIAHLETLLRQKNEYVRSKLSSRQVENRLEEPGSKSVTDRPDMQTRIKRPQEKGTEEMEKASSKEEKTIPVPQRKRQKADIEAKERSGAGPAESRYDSDPRIRTGAYNIIGIDKEVTVREGQTLYSISRGHLGAGMECYVEAVNGGITTVKVGQKLKIPKLKLKKRKRL